MTRPRLRFATLLVALVLGGSACAGRSPAAQLPANAAPIELNLRGSDGSPIELASLRGLALLVFLFTTFDDASQLALTPLTHALKKHDDVRALGIALQPNPAQLLPLYSEALALSFPLAFDPDDRIVAGHSDLGAIETVPSYVMLDAQGRIVAHHVGAMNEAQLDAFIALAKP